MAKLGYARIYITQVNSVVISTKNYPNNIVVLNRLGGFLDSVCQNITVQVYGAWLKQITFYVQKHIATLALCYNSVLVPGKPLGAPASVKLLYSARFPERNSSLLWSNWIFRFPDINFSLSLNINRKFQQHITRVYRKITIEFERHELRRVHLVTIFLVSGF